MNLNIVDRPLSEGFGFNRPCRIGNKQTNYKSRVVDLQDGVIFFTDCKKLTAQKFRAAFLCDDV